MARWRICTQTGGAAAAHRPQEGSGCLVGKAAKLGGILCTFSLFNVGGGKLSAEQ
jgi:hypothetical protein